MSHAYFGDLHIEPGELHLWHFDHQETPEDDRTYYASLLNEEERARCNRFRFEKDRKCYAISHGLLRTLLSSYHHLPPTQWQFIDGPKGKPYVSSIHRCPLYFSLSHTSGRGVVGVSLDPMVGVDIENGARAVEYVSLAKRFFAPAEARDIELQAESIPEAFFRIWTLKEAYVKACGLGLSMSLSSFEFQMSEGQICLRDQNTYPSDGSYWQFHSILLGSGHAVGMAARQAAPLIVHHREVKGLGQAEMCDLSPDYAT